MIVVKLIVLKVTQHAVLDLCKLTKGYFTVRHWFLCLNAISE